MVSRGWLNVWHLLVLETKTLFNILEFIFFLQLGSDLLWNAQQVLHNPAPSAWSCFYFDILIFLFSPPFYHSTCCHLGDYLHMIYGSPITFSPPDCLINSPDFYSFRVPVTEPGLSLTCPLPDPIWILSSKWPIPVCLLSLWGVIN